MSTVDPKCGLPTMPNGVLIETRTLPEPFDHVGWRVWRYGEALWLRTFVHTLNSRTGEQMIQYSGSTRATPNSLQRTIRDELVAALTHEVDELLSFDGERPFDPHKEQDR